jgi:hypothetical protein
VHGDWRCLWRRPLHCNHEFHLLFWILRASWPRWHSCYLVGYQTHRKSPMKYSWSAVVNELRNAVLKNVSFKCETKAQEKDMTEYFRIMMVETDTFHPWNTDGLLSRELSKLPQRCNYRSIFSYWAWKNGRYKVEAILGDVFGEMEDNIFEWFGNPWNHPPGYKAPEVPMKRGCDELAEKYTGKIISAGRKGV